MTVAVPSQTTEIASRITQRRSSDNREIRAFQQVEQFGDISIRVLQEINEVFHLPRPHSARGRLERAAGLGGDEFGVDSTTRLRHLPVTQPEFRNMGFVTMR